MQLRGLLLSLHGLVDAGSIFRVMGGITREELELLALAEQKLRPEKPDSDPHRS